MNKTATIQLEATHVVAMQDTLSTVTDAIVMVCMLTYYIHVLCKFKFWNELIL